MTVWLWLSFADGSRPKGDTWIGGAYVGVEFPRLPINPDEGKAVLALAMSRAWDLGINPGGEVLARVLRGEPPEGSPRERLLTKADIEVERMR